MKSIALFYVLLFLVRMSQMEVDASSSRLPLIINTENFPNATDEGVSRNSFLIYYILNFSCRSLPENVINKHIYISLATYVVSD